MDDAKRLTADEMLQHPWVSVGLHCLLLKIKLLTTLLLNDVVNFTTLSSIRNSLNTVDFEIFKVQLVV